MNSNGFGKYLGSAFGLSLLALLIFIVLQWLKVPAGSMIDWIIGIISFWWLLVVVTVPWNIHFKAREVMDAAHDSRHRKINFKPEDLAYAQQWVGRSLVIAIALHAISAGALYALAATGISPVGYISSVAALLLTLLRPVVRAYEYVVRRLSALNARVRYPHDDVVELREQVATLKGQVTELENALNADDKHSWRSHVASEHTAQKARLDALYAAIDNLRAANLADHQRLAREAEGAIARISADSQFLSHVREIIRFVKES